jgi:hypothetical protein
MASSAKTEKLKIPESRAAEKRDKNFFLSTAHLLLVTKNDYAS